MANPYSILDYVLVYYTFALLLCIYHFMNVFITLMWVDVSCTMVVHISYNMGTDTYIMSLRPAALGLG